MGDAVTAHGLYFIFCILIHLNPKREKQMSKPQILRKKIRAIPASTLESLPDNEHNSFKKYKVIPLELIVKASWNYKENDEFMSGQLKNNIKRNGQIATCQVRELDTGYYEMVDGNHRHDAFTQLEYEYVFAYDHGKISQAEAMRIAVETNETKFKYNSEKLSALLNDIKLEFPEIDLLTTLPFTDTDFSNMIDLSLIESADEVQEDNYNQPAPEKPKTKRGDIYAFNGHRLLCGDSTAMKDVNRLMDNKKAHLLFTDPPYNINYAEFNASRTSSAKDWTADYCSDWKDSMTDNEYKVFLSDFLRIAKTVLIYNAHYYVWHATSYQHEVLSSFVANDIPFDKVPIVWVKQAAPPSWVWYKRIYETCIYGGKGAVNGTGKNSRWFGPNNEVTVWNISRDNNNNYIHPTQKPLELPSRAIRNSSKAGEIVLDMFGGSGSTLIASDALGRLCYSMELEPKFCDVIVLRYMQYCADANKECKVLLNGNKEIQKNYFEVDDVEKH